MYDVVREVLVAPGNEYLGAAHAIGAIGLFNRFGFHQPKIGAAAGLGKTHGAGPFAGHHFWGDGFLHPVGPGGDQGAIGAGGQHRVHGERLVGAHSHFADRHGEEFGHPGAAKFSRRTQSSQPASQ